MGFWEVGRFRWGLQQGTLHGAIIHADTARRRPSASQEESPHQTLNLLHLGLGLPELQNCEESNLLFKPPRLRYSVRAAWMDQTTCSWAGLLGVLRSQVAHTSELPPERTRKPEYPAVAWENSFRQKGRTPPASSGTLNCSWGWTGRWLRSCGARNLNLPRSWTPDYDSTWHIL